MIRRAISFLEQRRLQIALTALMVFISGGFQVHQALDRAQYDSQESVNLQYHPIAFILGALAPAVFILAPFVYWMFGRIVRRTAARFKERADTVGAMDQRREPRTQQRTSRRVLVTMCVLGLVLIGSVGILTVKTQRPYTEEYFAALRRGDYATALRLIRPLADQGNAAAQLQLAFMYDNGYGVPKNKAEAVKWYRLAAGQGELIAQYNLAVSYANGQGVPQDYAEAAKWYRKAADQGNDDAQFGVGLMYDNGYGAPKNNAEAVKWYRLAADQGNVAAQNNLGHMYLDGRGVPQDYVSAYMWLNLAAAQFGELATSSRDAVAQKMSPAQIAEAQTLTREWKPTKRLPR